MMMMLMMMIIIVNSLEGKTTTLHVHHTFSYISLPCLHGGRKQATAKFYFFFWTWIGMLRIQLQPGGSPTFDKVNGFDWSW